MLVYPFNGPVILNNQVFVNYGGQTGTFSDLMLQNSYWLAEMQVTSYLGTPLLPTIITGTYPFMNKHRLATDYGYVSQLLNVNILTRERFDSCELTSRGGGGYIYEDTFGYVDFRQLASVCSCANWWGGGFAPYQIQIVYEAGLPTGTANQPGILEALTILAQIDLNEKVPGLVGANESPGDVAVESFKSMDYWEKRKATSFIKTSLGDSPKAMRAKRLIDATVRRARKVLMA